MSSVQLIKLTTHFTLTVPPAFLLAFSVPDFFVLDISYSHLLPLFGTGR